jgi:hypothetical protein
MESTTVKRPPCTRRSPGRRRRRVAGCSRRARESCRNRGLQSRRDSAGDSVDQITRAWCRITAIATRDGFGIRATKLATWRPCNHALIPFKDVKGVIDCRGAARATFGQIPRSMCAGSIHHEDSVNARQ